jgi:hypothetical protein
VNRGVFSRVREMGCYLARVGTWAARVWRRSAVGQVRTKEGKTDTGKMILYAMVIATLLIIGGVELNPGPVENIMQVTCKGCNRT